MRRVVFVRNKTDPSTLRAVDAVPVGQGCYRLLGSTDSALEFNRGEVVECSIEEIQDGTNVLVATHSLSTDPENRKRRIVYATLGGIFGAPIGLWVGIELFQTFNSALLGALVGTILFAYSSARWGDRAWELLRRVV